MRERIYLAWRLLRGDSIAYRVRVGPEAAIWRKPNDPPLQVRRCNIRAGNVTTGIEL